LSPSRVRHEVHGIGRPDVKKIIGHHGPDDEIGVVAEPRDAHRPGGCIERGEALEIRPAEVAGIEVGHTPGGGCDEQSSPGKFARDEILPDLFVELDTTSSCYCPWALRDPYSG